MHLKHIPVNNKSYHRKVILNFKLYSINPGQDYLWTSIKSLIIRFFVASVHLTGILNLLEIDFLKDKLIRRVEIKSAKVEKKSFRELESLKHKIFWNYICIVTFLFSKITLRG